MWASPPASDGRLLETLATACYALAAGAIAVWLGVFFVRMHRLRRARLELAAEEELTGIVLDQLSGYEASAVKLNVLPEWKRDILLRILQNLIEQTKGRDQANLVRILHDAGFHAAALASIGAATQPAARQTACIVLSYFADDASNDALRRSLGDADPAVRLTAARALLKKDMIDRLETLLERLGFSRDDPPLVLSEIFVRLPARLQPEAIELLRERKLPAEWSRMLTLALARNQVFDAFDAIAGLRHAPESRVRSAAWVALAELGDPRAGDFVLEGLRDPAPDVRRVAAECAGKLGGPEVVSELQRLATEGDWWSRYRAASALAAFGNAGRTALQELVRGAPREDPARQAWQDSSGGGSDGR